MGTPASDSRKMITNPRGGHMNFGSRIVSSTVRDGASILTERDIVVDSLVAEEALMDRSIVIDGVIREGSTAQRSRVIESELLEQTEASQSNILGSEIVKSVVFDSTILNSDVHNSGIFSSVVNGGRVRDSRLENQCLVMGDVTNCKLDNATVEYGAVLMGIQTPYPLYFKQGYWERLPFFVDDAALSYYVQEDVNDRVLIGCQSRPGSFWLSLTLEQVQKLGNEEFAESFELYRKAVQEVMDYKASNPSPVVAPAKEKTQIDPDWDFGKISK